MEFQKNDIWVGLFVLVALALVLATVVTVARGRFGETYPLIAHFDTISNVEAGTPVQLRGYRVGEVKSIRFIPEPEIQFEVNFVVNRQLVLRQGTRAVIASTNVIGENFLDLDISGAAGDPLEAGDTIPGDSASGIGQIMGQVNGLLTSARGTIDRLRESLGPGGAEGEGEGLSFAEFTQAAADLRGLLANLNQLTAAARPEVAKTGALVRDELTQARFVTAHAGSLVAENRAELRSLLVHTDEMIVHLDSLLVVTHALAADNRDELANIMKELEKATAHITTLTEEVSERPWKLLFR